jgi:PAS domain S-box-containing protein
VIDIPEPPDFLENAPIALLQTDSSGVIVRVNQAALELLQARDASTISNGQNLAQYFSSQEHSKQAFTQLKSAGVLKEFAAIFKTPDGSLRHVIIDASVSRNISAEAEQFNFFIRDITTSWLKQSQASAQFDITKVLIGATAIVEALEQICTTLCTLLSFEIGIVWRIDERANRMSRLVHKIVSDADKHEYLVARSVNVPLSWQRLPRHNLVQRQRQSLYRHRTIRHLLQRTSIANNQNLSCSCSLSYLYRQPNLGRDQPSFYQRHTNQ